MEKPGSVLSVQDLQVEFATIDGVVHAVNGVSFDLHEGETLALVGETGCGKSVTVLAALGLLAEGGRIRGGAVRFQGRDLTRLPPREMRRLLGRDLAMIYQDPRSSLNPVLSIGTQVSEAIRAHDGSLRGRVLRERATGLLRLVGVPQPEMRYDQYPHQFSGGMCQRVVVAMAIANKPSVLVADEPTTAVDVTIQAQLLGLLDDMRKEVGAALILITHDLGVVAEVADTVCVMYAGRIVEKAPVEALFSQPRHPYTLGLLRSLPRIDAESGPLKPVPGQPPDLRRIMPGCTFRPRCPAAGAQCGTDLPVLRQSGGADHLAACHFPVTSAARGTDHAAAEWPGESA